MKKAMIMGACVILAGCATAPTIGPPITVAPNVESQVKERVANQLKDPLAAQFRNIRAFSTDQGVLVCGEVNGKNSFGGYIGFVHFIQMGDRTPSGYSWKPVAMETSPNDALLSSIWQSYYPGCYQ